MTRVGSILGWRWVTRLRVPASREAGIPGRPGNFAPGMSKVQRMPSGCSITRIFPSRKRRGQRRPGNRTDKAAASGDDN